MTDEPVLMRGDCLRRMAEIPDASIDMIAADLPYGTTKCRWDTVIPLDLLWSHYKRIIKPRGAIVLTASQPFTSALVMSNPKWFRYEWIWRKNLPSGFLDANRKPLKLHESILVFCDRAAPYFPQGLKGRRRRRRKACTAVYGKFGNIYMTTGQGFPRSVLDFPRVFKPVHSTQKPVELLEYLVRTYTSEGGTVLDNTMGSGTTGVACANTGRRFIGIEKDPGFFSVAKRRIAAAQAAQQRLAA